MYPFLWLFYLILFSISFSAQAEGISFAQFWEKVLLTHPGIRAQDAAIKSVESAPALEIPAPEISVSEMNDKVPFTSSMGKMQRTLELSQSLPFPAKFSKADELKKSNVEKGQNERELYIKNLKREAFLAFLMYAKNFELRKILKEKESFYQAHKTKSRTLIVTSQSYQEHLLSIELELSMLKSEMKMAEIELNNSAAMMRQLQNDPAKDLNLGEVELEALTPPSLKATDSFESHPMLKMSRSEISSMRKDLEMGKLEWAPDLMFKLRDIKSYDMNVPGGKEIMVGISLPFAFFNQRNDKNESLAQRVMIYEHKDQQIKNELQGEYAALTHQLKEEWELLNIYKEKTMPLIEKRMKFAYNLNTLDMETLDNHRMAIDQMYDLRLKILETEMNYRTSYFKLKELLNNDEGK